MWSFHGGSVAVSTSTSRARRLHIFVWLLSLWVLRLSLHSNLLSLAVDVSISSLFVALQ